ncbi:hypothetical protein NDU88_005700 [Pleurodeles waltl]|uniref:Ion transport N-terminal domain-containing protein n=1 Tax=Pleurodeles waltl TaxID=8319 RepID=A0AAV7RKF1_PLEWA|nr:hypothetical protein NDU88_005700 [Pleurodeles waltl]
MHNAARDTREGGTARSGHISFAVGAAHSATAVHPEGTSSTGGTRHPRSTTDASASYTGGTSQTGSTSYHGGSTHFRGTELPAQTKLPGSKAGPGGAAEIAAKNMLMSRRRRLTRILDVPWRRGTMIGPDQEELEEEKKLLSALGFWHVPSPMFLPVVGKATLALYRSRGAIVRERWRIIEAGKFLIHPYSSFR